MTHHNVRTFYTFKFIQAFGRGIWVANILNLLIVVMTEQGQGLAGFNGNTTVGLTSLVMGGALLLTFIPGGILADRWNLRKQLILAAILGLLGLIVVALSPNLYWVFGGLAIWGLYQGLGQPAVDAILAHSTPRGARSKSYSKAHILEQVGSATGPVLNILIFAVLGDNWDVDTLRLIMVVGLAFSFASVVVMLLFKTDSDSMYANEEDRVERSGNPPKDGVTENKGNFTVAMVFLVSSFIIGWGAGMTVKFFPIFFKNIYDLSPIAVQAITGTGLFVTGLFTFWGQKISRTRGRGAVVVVLQYMAIACLVGLAFYPPVEILVILFVLRQALMNAATPLSRSIVIDNTPAKRRGIVSSWQNVAWGLFWNVSAVIGGLLIGENDNFRLGFLITAGVYVVGVSVVLPVINRVNKEA